MKRLLALAAALTLLAAVTPRPAFADTIDAQAQQWEAQVGQQEYQQLQQQGVIVPSSPYYAILNPIAQQIKSVADRQYWHPFTFILVHEKSPNAFSVPGGNVYVTDSLMQFVENREELAGVLCHEVSHDIHHDVLHLAEKDQRAATNYSLGALAIDILTGGRANNVVGNAAQIAFNFQTTRYSRGAESAADQTGSDVCAASGSNPWGLVWLFERFSKENAGGTFEALSDHPTDDHRVADLEAHFRTNPQLFARYNPNIASATPLNGSRRTTTSAYRRR